MAHLMTAPLRLALLGAGKIAEFHVPAARRAGFEVVAVAARPGSTTPAALAERHGIPRVFDGAEALLAARDEWDALLISVPVPDLLSVLERSLEAGAPVLVEKPVALRSRDLDSLAGRDLPVMVAYNRRFYPGVQAAREELRVGPPALGALTLPEGITGWAGPDGDAEPLYLHFSNSVHGLDLLQFLFGPLEVVHTERLPLRDGSVPGLVATLRSERGDVVQVLVNWGTPTNTAVTVDWPGRRLELRPYEHLVVYDAMQVVDPTDDVPIRTYRPQVAAQVPLTGDDVEFKPGFVGQMQAFASLCGGGDPGPGASLADAASVLRLAEGIVGTTW
jgi:predicted dehydrogenase